LGTIISIRPKCPSVSSEPARTLKRQSIYKRIPCSFGARTALPLLRLPYEVRSSCAPSLPIGCSVVSIRNRAPLPATSMHPSAWNVVSQKSICRTVHRAPVLRRIRPLLTPKTQTSNQNTSRTGIKRRSGQYAASRQDADTGRGGQEFMGAVCYQRSGRPDLGVCTSQFQPLSSRLGPLGRREPAPQLQRPFRRL
jgi:hypothetical protein